MKSQLSLANKTFLYVLRLKISSESKVAKSLENFLEEKGLQFVAMYDLIKRTTVFEKYFDSSSEAYRTKKELLTILKNVFPPKDLGNISFAVRRIKKENWSESWKKNFHVIKASKRIVIKPSWEFFTPKEGQIVIELDPGMSFGTGNHPTTTSCIKLLDMIAKENGKKSFLDIGCGSGILVIAAAKLGFAPCTALDNDPLAVTTARKNSRINKVVDRITLAEADINLLAAKKTFDVVAANLLSSILEKNAPKISKMVSRNGYLILSGILRNEYKKIVSLYTSLGFREKKKLFSKEWSTGLFIKKY